MPLLFGLVLASLPIISFGLQYHYSQAEGTTAFLFGHYTVSIVDWIFVIFNFFVVRIIDWQMGKRFFFIFSVSVVLNVFAHANWQMEGVDKGHMIDLNGRILLAGWVHLGFSIIQTSLLMGFVFARRQVTGGISYFTTVLALCYFAGLGISSYFMHPSFPTTDIVAMSLGFITVLTSEILAHFQQWVPKS